MGWIWKIPSNATGNEWINRGYVKDNNLQSYAYTDVGSGYSYSEYFYIHLPEYMKCKGFRFYHYGYGSSYCNTIKVHFWDGSDWVNPYSGATEKNQWNEITTLPTKVINQARIAISGNGESNFRRAWEFQFYVEEPYEVEGAGGMILSGKADISWEGGVEEPYEVEGAGGMILSGIAPAEADEDTRSIKTKVLIEIKLSDSYTLRCADEDIEFPKTGSTKLYEELIIDSGNIEETLNNMYFGTKNINNLNFSLSNIGSRIKTLRDSYEFRKKEVTVKRVDVENDEVLESYIFLIQDMKLNLEQADFTAMPEDLDVYKTIIPKLRITEELFPTVISESLGNPIHVCFGMANGVPLYCINEDTVNDNYDYLIGHGTITDVSGVYREGNGVKVEVPSIAICSGTATSTSTKKLIASAATFITDNIRTNMQVKNDTDNIYTFVVSVDSETQLTVKDDIFESGDEYSIGGEFIFYNGSQQSPYPGYAFLRFPVEQRDFNGNLYSLTATVQGIKINGAYEEKAVKVFQEFMTNTVWGLGRTVNNTYFDYAASLLSGTKVGGFFWEFKQVSEWIDYFLTACRLAILRNGTSGYEIVVPEYIGITSCSFEEGEMVLINDWNTPISEYVSDVILHFAYDVDENIYKDDVSCSTGKEFGEVRDYYSPFTQEKATAETITKLLCNRFIYQDYKINFRTGKKSARRKLHDIIKATYETLGLDNSFFEIINISKKANDYEIVAAEYSNNIFNLD